MKSLWKMTTDEIEKAGKDFLELHQASTEVCKLTFEVNRNGSIDFYSVNSETLFAIEEVIMFAKFYQANVYCAYDGEKHRTVAHVH